MVLARLAVAVEHQGQGLGAALLKDAIGRTLAAADIAGIRALAVQAKDERGREFCEHFGFRPSPSDPLHLFVLLKDLRERCLPGASPLIRLRLVRQQRVGRGLSAERLLAILDALGLAVEEGVKAAGVAGEDGAERLQILARLARGTTACAILLVDGLLDVSQVFQRLLGHGLAGHFTCEAGEAQFQPRCRGNSGRPR